MSEDPIGFNGGDANLYRYVGNEVTTFVDPSGTWGIWDYWYGNGYFNQQGTKLDNKLKDYWKNHPGDPFDQARNFRHYQLIGSDTAVGDIRELSESYANFAQTAATCAVPISTMDQMVLNAAKEG
jgi:uncharacterized protein RhaS with RHS repeats